MNSKNSLSGGPSWRRLVHRVDRAVSPPANAFVRTNLFADSVSALTRLEAQMKRRVERYSSTYWHFFNMPTATDLRRVWAQLSMLEARLRDLDERIEVSYDDPLDAAKQKDGAERVAEQKD